MATDPDSDSSYDPSSSLSPASLSLSVSVSPASLPQRGQRMRLWLRPDYTTLQTQLGSSPCLLQPPPTQQTGGYHHNVSQDGRDCFSVGDSGEESVNDDDVDGNGEGEGGGADVDVELGNNKNEDEEKEKGMVQSICPQQQEQHEQQQHFLQESSSNSSSSEIEWPRSNLSQHEDGPPRNNTTTTSAVGSVFDSPSPSGSSDEQEEKRGPSPLRPSRALRAATRAGGRWAVVAGHNAQVAPRVREQETQVAQTLLPPAVITTSSPLPRATAPGKRTSARHRPTATTAEHNNESLIPNPVFQITPETRPYHTLAATARQHQIYTSRLHLDNAAARGFSRSNTRGAYTPAELREERVKQNLRRALLAHMEKVLGRKNVRTRWIQAGLLEGMVSGLAVTEETVYQPPWRHRWEERGEEERRETAGKEEDRKRQSAVWVLANLKGLERLKRDAEKRVARAVPSNDAGNGSDNLDNNNTQATVTAKATPSRGKRKSEDRSRQKIKRNRMSKGHSEGLYVGMRQVDWTQFEDSEEDRPFTLPGLVGAYNTVQGQEYPEYLHQSMRPAEGV